MSHEPPQAKDFVLGGHIEAGAEACRALLDAARLDFEIIYGRPPSEADAAVICQLFIESRKAMYLRAIVEQLGELVPPGSA